MSTDWLERYQAGEHAQVWDEMQALGADIHNPASGGPAQKVVRETMTRAQQNVLRLLDELAGLGYRSAGLPEPPEPDYALELRIQNALEYVKTRGGRKYKSNPWAHPALAWVEEEDIDVPGHFRDGKPGRNNYRPPSARTQSALHEVEQRTGAPLSLAVRGWFETVGSVDLAGTHPALNRDGSISVLRVTLAEIDAYNDPGAGAPFVAGIRHAFEWGGFPGWSERPKAPRRELDALRSKLVPL